MNLNDVTRATAIQRARNYRGAKAGFQTSIYWAVNQTLNGNADGLYMIMLHAGMVTGKGHEMTTCADGRQLWAYWSDGLGLKGILSWDKDKSKFKMQEGWKLTAGKIDIVALMTALSETPWHMFRRVPASKAFDLDKAVMRLLTLAGNNGLSPDEVISAVKIAAGQEKAPAPVKTTTPIEYANLTPEELIQLRSDITSGDKTIGDLPLNTRYEQVEAVLEAA
jgi:hypothetical protein